MSKKITQKSGSQIVKTCQICIMKLHIGHVIEQVYKNSNISAKAMCEGLNCSRSTIYHIFKSESIQTDQLWALSKFLGHNFFRYYHEAYIDEFPTANVLNEPAEKYKPIVNKRKVMVEVMLTEKEYEELLRKRID